MNQEGIVDDCVLPINDNLSQIEGFRWLIVTLCLFIACLTFKPSEPYLSEFLICALDTHQEICDGLNFESCSSEKGCAWNNLCGVRPCANISSGCGGFALDYCHMDGDTCATSKCYKNFSENEVNNEIYPWSTYAYLPFLLFMGPFAELYSYRVCILVGISGRVATRYLLLFGKSLLDMQMMQVMYSMGTAAEDVFTAYVYYVVHPSLYQQATSYIKACSFLSSVIAGVTGDLLVTQGHVSLDVLMIISAAFVCAGAAIGLCVLRPSNKNHALIALRSHSHGHASTELGEGFGSKDAMAARTGTVHLPRGGALDAVASPGSDANLEGDSTWSPLVADSAGPTLPVRGLDGSNHAIGDDSAPDESNLTPSVRPPQPLSSTSSSSQRTSDHILTEPKREHRREDGGSTRLQTLRTQIGYLRIVLRSDTFKALLLWWVLGQSAFSIVYGYEVSIYEELHGGNSWNGCVLAIMQLGGAVGAMAPSWLATGSLSMHKVSLRLACSGVVASMALVGAVLTWDVVASMAFLIIYFAAWQFISAVFYARLALALRMAKTYSQPDTDVHESAVPEVLSGFVDVGVDSDEEEVYFYSTARQRDEVAQKKAMLNGKERAKAKQDEGEGEWGIMESGGPLSATPMKIGVTSSASKGSGGGGVADSLGGGLGRGIDGGARTSRLGAPNKYSGYKYSGYSASRASKGRERSSTMSFVDDDGVQMAGSTSTHTDGGSGGSDGDQDAGGGGVDPPYSIAVVCVVGLSVVVQSLLQAVLLSGLRLPLRDVCFVLALMTCIATGLYIATCVVWYGWNSSVAEALEAIRGT